MSPSTDSTDRIESGAHSAPEQLTDDPRRAALAMLDALADLAARVGPDTFTVPHAAFCDSTIGQHVRHCLDHFEALVVGLPSGRVDYDARARDARIETSPAAASGLAAGLRQRLAAAVLSLDAPVAVRLACGLTGALRAQRSSVGRELQFVVGHTVHHFAILAAQCRLLDVPVAADFGVAPSTLRHRANPAHPR